MGAPAQFRKTGKLAPQQMSILLTGLFLSSYITSTIGVHELIGAFLFGVASLAPQHAEPVPLDR